MTDTAQPKGVFAQIAQVYQTSRKDRDLAWNVYVARPLAAVLVWILARTPFTPNQVSFIGAFLFFGVALALVASTSPWAVVAAAFMIQFSYLFDCADGQLARLTGKASSVGMYLDFLIDELKAALLVGALSVRLWLVYGQEWWLIAGIVGVSLASLATSLTTFIRRPEYAGEEIKPGVYVEREAPRSLVGKVVRLIETVAQLVIHYPSWFHFAAILGLFDLMALVGVTDFRLDGALIFFVPFMGIYLLYASKTTLAIFLKLASPKFYDQPKEGEAS